MSKRLESFYKLFFIVIFLIIFSGVKGNSTPDLPEQITPELEQIEALPRRKKPAELNIEVTKIKSESLEEAYIDRINKCIYINFSDKNKLEVEYKNYNLVIRENINNLKKSNYKIFNYKLIILSNKQVIRIPYEKEPSKLFLEIYNNKNIFKIYTIDLENIKDIYNSRKIINTSTLQDFILAENDLISSEYIFKGELIATNTEDKGPHSPIVFLENINWHESNLENPRKIRTLKEIVYLYNNKEIKVQPYLILNKYSDLPFEMKSSINNKNLVVSTYKKNKDKFEGGKYIQASIGFNIDEINKELLKKILNESQENELTFETKEEIIVARGHIDGSEFENKHSKDDEKFKIPNIIIKKNLEKNVSLSVTDKYTYNEIIFTENSCELPQGVSSINYDKGVLLGIPYENKIRVIFENKVISEVYSNNLGEFRLENLHLKKINGEIKLDIQYKNKVATLKINEILDNSKFNFKIEHYINNEIKKVSNIEIETIGNFMKKGVYEILVNSKYNPKKGNTIVIDNKGIVSEDRLLEVFKISGEDMFPPQGDEFVSIVYESNEDYINNLMNNTIDFNNQLKIKILNEINSIKLLPIYWKGSVEKKFVLRYRKKYNNKIVKEFEFTIKTPKSFFVVNTENVSLDFGKIIKENGSGQAKTFINLYYENLDNLNPEFTLPSEVKLNGILPVALKATIDNKTSQGIEKNILIEGTIFEIPKDADLGIYKGNTYMLFEIK